MNRLWRLLQHLFGEPPPPRPTGHVPDRLHRRHHRHGHDEAADETPDDDGPGPAPTHHTHHGH